MPESQAAPVALITGANRGIGLEVARQLGAQGFEVIMGSRDLSKGETGAARLRDEGLQATALQFDVTDAASITGAREWLEAERGVLDVLVNNAATNYDTWQGVLDADLDEVMETLEANTVGPWRMVQAMLPLLRRSAHPRIVNVTSVLGTFGSLSGRAPGYGLSKLALNGLTVMLANQLRADRILVNAVCPGWVATDMGGPNGRPIPDGAAGIVWAATLPDDGPTGGVFRDGKPMAL